MLRALVMPGKGWKQRFLWWEHPFSGYRMRSETLLPSETFQVPSGLNPIDTQSTHNRHSNAIEFRSRWDRVANGSLVDGLRCRLTVSGNLTRFQTAPSLRRGRHGAFRTVSPKGLFLSFRKVS